MDAAEHKLRDVGLLDNLLAEDRPALAAPRGGTDAAFPTGRPEKRVKSAAHRPCVTQADGGRSTYASPRLLATEHHSGCRDAAHWRGSPSAALSRPAEAFAAISARAWLAGGREPFKRATRLRDDPSLKGHGGGGSLSRC